MSASNSKVTSYKDVQIAFLLDGIPGVDRLVGKRKNPGAVLRRALHELQKQGSEVGELEDYIAERCGSVGRGRSLPSVGDERRYKAQQIKEGAPFVRLPLCSLGIKKGQGVRVRFESDQIVVCKS